MYEAIKKIILIDLPSLDPLLKVPITAVLIAITAFLLVAIWRDPLRASALDPQTETRLERGTQSFFQNSQQFAPDPAIVFGNAKDIVRRMKDYKNVFQAVDGEI
jgi:hypothetical protein